MTEEHFKKILRITLREEAIAMAAELASNGDIVLIAGKGHECHQEINGHFYPFSDIQVAKKIFLKTD